MKHILRLALVLALTFTGLWALARQQLLAAAEAFLADQQAQGGGGRVSAGLSPMELDLSLTDLVLIDPATGTRISSPEIAVAALSYQPWQISAHSASAQIQAAQRITWTADQARTELLITPSLDLALQQIRVDGKGWHFASDGGWAIGFKDVSATVNRLAAVNSYSLEGRIDQLAPDPAFSRALSPIGLDSPAKELTVDAVLVFDRPIDRHLGSGGPELTAIHLGSVRLIWGEMALLATGKLTADAEGLAEGDITLDIVRPKEFLALAVAMGVLSAEQAGLLQKGLTAYADPLRPDAARVPFTLTGGLIKLGPFPIGPALRLNGFQRQ